MTKLKVPACQSLSTINESNTEYHLFSVDAAYLIKSYGGQANVK